MKLKGDPDREYPILILKIRYSKVVGNNMQKLAIQNYIHLLYNHLAV